MEGYSISEVAERTGFPASTLRFYDQSGLVRPARTPAGYRCYDDGQVELLGFIGRAKRMGLTLDEIADVVALLDEERCAPVQGQLRELVDAKISDAERRMAELVAFTAELRWVSSALGRHTPEGPCDDACGCTTDPGSTTTTGVVLAPAANRPGGPPIVGTLDADHAGARVAGWQAVLARATTSEPIAGGAPA